MLVDVLKPLPRPISLACFTDAWSRRIKVYGGSHDIMLMTLLQILLRPFLPGSYQSLRLSVLDMTPLAKDISISTSITQFICGWSDSSEKRTSLYGIQDLNSYCKQSVLLALSGQKWDQQSDIKVERPAMCLAALPAAYGEQNWFVSHNSQP